MLIWNSPTIKLPQDGVINWLKLHNYSKGITFIPNHPQFQLIKQVGQCLETNKRIFLMTSANGAGKSTTWCNIVANVAYPGLNWYNFAKDQETGEENQGFFNYPLYHSWPEKWPKLIWIVGDPTKMASLNQKLEEWLPGDPETTKKYRRFKGKYEYHSRYELGNDFKVRFLTTEMSWKSFETDDVGMVIFDEPPKHSQFQAAVFRIRSGGVIIMAATAVHESGWFLDDVVDKADRQGGYHFHQTVHIDENGIDTGGHWDLGEYGIHPKGNLATVEIDLMKSECPPELYPARIEGKLLILSGTIFKNYKQDKIYIRESELESTLWPYERRWYEYRMIVDDADRRPPYLIWVRIDRWGRRRVLREWPSIHEDCYQGLYFHKIEDRHPLDMEKICDRLVVIEQEVLNIPLYRLTRLFDPNFGLSPHRNKTGSTMVQYWQEKMQEAYDRYQKANNIRQKMVSPGFITEIEDDIQTGHEKIREALEPTADGTQLFTIDPDNNENLDLALRRYKWKEMDPNIRDIDGLWAKIEQLHKDKIDVVRYDLVVPFHWRPVPGFNQDSNTAGDYSRNEANNGINSSPGYNVPSKPKGVA